MHSLSTTFSKFVYLLRFINILSDSCVFISFGGLLMSIKGGLKELKNLELDSRVYLLIKKI